MDVYICMYVYTYYTYTYTYYTYTYTHVAIYVCIYIYIAILRGNPGLCHEAYLRSPLDIHHGVFISNSVIEFSVHWLENIVMGFKQYCK